MSIFDRRATVEAMKVAEAGQSRHRRRNSMATVAGISTTVLGVDLTNYSYHCGVAALRWDHNLEEVISNNV